MAREYLKDNCNRIMGWIDDQGSREYIYDSTGHQLGWYQKNTDSTFDNCGRMLGRGNTLTRLLRY